MALDRLASSSSTQDMCDYEQYMAISEATLLTAHEIAADLRGVLRRVERAASSHSSTPQYASSESGQTGAMPEMTRATLPPIPIPSFAGDIWEWDNFWALFNANVHSQPIPNLLKFNHLLNALKGEPRRAVLRFQVSEANYQRAIDFLHSKYTDKEVILHDLIQRLESASLQSNSLKEQRGLLDQLQVIIAQLRDKGEQVDNQLLFELVLAKFPAQVQREVLKKKGSMEEPLSMQGMLDVLEKYISSEERIASLTSNDKGKQPQQITKQERPSIGQPLRKPVQCMYCDESHRAVDCSKLDSPQLRANYLRQHKLCMICASPKHSTEECKGRNCFACQGRHHTSCCLKQKRTNATPEARPSTQKEKQSSGTAKLKSRENDNPRLQKPIKQFTAHYQDEDSSEQEDEEMEAIAEYHSSKQQIGIKETFLPLGELTILDPNTHTLRRITALLDSGAECSFIDKKLADELNLQSLSSSTLQVRTFGATNNLECKTRMVALDAWDNDGQPCHLQFLTHDILTSTLRTPPIVDEDAVFIKENKMQINVVSKRKAKPQILLGSDQLWQMIYADKPQVRLPSGLYLLPTRLGHLLTGQLNVQHQEASKTNREQTAEGNKLANIYTAMSMAFPEQRDAEQDSWQKHWSYQDEGQEEFGRSEQEIQQAIDSEVLKNFQETVQKRQDGYYVRLPWKNIPVALPDNRAIAMRRLASVWTSLRNNEELLSNGIKRAELGSVKRTVAFVLRFIHNAVECHNARQEKHIQLSPLFDEAKPSYSPIPDGLEIKRATKMVAKQHQLAWIAPATQAALKHLNLYMDHEGILRCRGRLGKSAMSKEAKFPMLVLQKTWLSRLIIEDCHAKQHPGISHTMCKIKELYRVEG
ncbi:unnamed protein product [Nippostrongylus brasiliensis]|uniref:DUF1758 domain-containing protein n=1 Tax=Nippostrongylus brasiliensis TaxID=27835 RepID=A0A0N4Y7S6_NIPBR|nr:unnamed protein product [Nippostrongylus brasiliensis]